MTFAFRTTQAVSATLYHLNYLLFLQHQAKYTCLKKTKAYGQDEPPRRQCQRISEDSEIFQRRKHR